ncbi:ATP-dependent DNA helicase RecG [Verrucomicrobia bacterium]|nr:ATP-dependent DNA helicase RecG [Verrucomicrobiota bacterium]
MESTESTAPDLVQGLSGVGAKKGELLAKLKITTHSDLLLHRPRRYEDRRHCCAIEEAEDGVPAVFRGTIQSINLRRFRHRRGSVVELVLSDETGELTCRWWNQSYVSRAHSEGTEILVYGKPANAKKTTIDQPEIELVENDEKDDIHLNRIVPIYPLTQGVHQRWLRTLVWDSLKSFSDQIEAPQQEIGSRLKTSRSDALWSLHFPDTIEATVEAQTFFAEEELLSFQLKLQTRRLRFNQRAKAPACTNDNHLVQPFLAQLPFQLTAAQERVMREIRSDLNQPSSMRRLLQGDVGSGKTVVATLTSLMMLESGFDVAFMAPTELLAEQHFKTLSAWLDEFDIGLALCTASSKTISKESKSTLTIGTHALLEKSYEPSQLGLVIIDEQHRFGVSQRDRLLRKGPFPHLLTMTATPIPRSLGLTVYGDLEHSIIDQLPKDRGEIKTYVRSNDRLDRIWTFIEQQVNQGRQAYVIYPRIEEETEGTLKAVESEFKHITSRFPLLKVACLHGRIDRDQSTQTMDAFRQNEIQILVATSVIEVGVDVPNATVMLIENAERFGLAQLHQMRGRIGRGKEDSHCILVSHEANENGWERLRTLESNRDGFAIAENDLRHRGPGEFLGQQQSGLPRFRFADLIEHRELVREIRTLVRVHLGLEKPPIESDVAGNT